MKNNKLRIYLVVMLRFYKRFSVNLR